MCFRPNKFSLYYRNISATLHKNTHLGSCNYACEFYLSYFNQKKTTDVIKHNCVITIIQLSFTNNACSLKKKTLACIYLSNPVENHSLALYLHLIHLSPPFFLNFMAPPPPHHPPSLRTVAHGAASDSLIISSNSAHYPLDNRTVHPLTKRIILYVLGQHNIMARSERLCAHLTLFQYKRK